MIVPFFIAAANAASSRASIVFGEFAEGGKFVPLDVVPLALRKAVDEERTLVLAKQHDAPEPAGLALPLPRQPLLDHAAAEVRIDEPLVRATDGFAKLLVGNAFWAPAKRANGLVLKTRIGSALFYDTKSYST